MANALAPLDYSKVILPNSPSLYWRLNDTGATAVDGSGNTRDGTFTATDITKSVTGALPNDSNKCIEQNATANPNISSTYNPFTNGTVRTFEGWAMRLGHQTADNLIGSAGAGNSVSLHLSANLPHRVDFSADAGGVGTDGTWLMGWPNTGQWVHFALVFDETADTAELFTNGVSQGSKSVTRPYNATPGNFMAGGRGAAVGPTNPFFGRLDEIAVYESALSAATILAHYRAGAAIGP